MVDKAIKRVSLISLDSVIYLMVSDERFVKKDFGYFMVVSDFGRECVVASEKDFSEDGWGLFG